MEASALRAPAGLAARRPGGVLLRLRSDEQLVALFRQGNEDAFRVIHDRYRQRLAAYARQMLGGSATDADDAMQDVFLRAYAALSADDRPVTLRAWLYRVAHNRCIDHIRRPASQPTLELSESVRPLAATTGDPILAAERREDLRRLVIDVRALPEQQRSALLMREMEGLSYQELAGALDVTIPAVKSLLVRARMGLVESQQARDTPCQAIREDIAGAHDRGVRASGRARRHIRECPGCAGYRTTLKGISGNLGALSPSTGPWGWLAKLIGLGAGGSGAAGGAAAAGAGGAAGAAGATGTVVAGAAATKLAAVVCCAALVGGGAVEVAREQAVPPRHRTTPAAAGPTGARAVTATALVALAGARGRATAAATRSAAAPATAHAAPRVTPARHDAATGLLPVTLTGSPSALGPAPAPAVSPTTHDGGAEAPAEDPAAADPVMTPDTATTGLDGAGGPLGLLGTDHTGDPQTSGGSGSTGATSGGTAAPSSSGGTITASGAQATPAASGTSTTGGGATATAPAPAPSPSPAPR